MHRTSRKHVSRRHGKQQKREGIRTVDNDKAAEILGLSPEDMAKIKEQSKGRHPSKPKAKGRSQSRVPVPEVEKDVAEDPTIWLVQHVYQREGEPEGLIHTNARRLAMQGGPGTAVYKHMHAAHAPCSESCRYKVVE